jgi:hypothetical protein
MSACNTGSGSITEVAAGVRMASMRSTSRLKSCRADRWAECAYKWQRQHQIQ